MVGGLVIFPKPRRRRDERNVLRPPVTIVTLHSVARSFLRFEKQDEFIYKWQLRSVLRTEDIDYGKAIEIWQTNEDELVK